MAPHGAPPRRPLLAKGPRSARCTATKAIAQERNLKNNRLNSSAIGNITRKNMDNIIIPNAQCMRIKVAYYANE